MLAVMAWRVRVWRPLFAAWLGAFVLALVPLWAFYAVSEGTLLPLHATWYFAGSEGASGELVRDGVDGRVVPPGDEEAIASALGSLLGDRERARLCGESARRRAEEFTPARAAEATLAFWRSLRAAETRSHRP